MALSVDHATKVITVPQGDLTLVSGTLYEMDSEADFRLKLMVLFANENHIWMKIPYNHNTEVTIAGVVYARTISIINGYSVRFTPDAQWTVLIKGSNNDIWDVENGILVQNQVQVIPTNSAGLQVTQGGGISPELEIKIEDVHAAHMNRRTRNTVTGREIIYEDDKVTPKHEFDSTDDGSQITEISPI